ncbi:hypothetical protein RD1_2339 [Roseobacter denitrificans OCh 114]|uniref:Uncharacterized protein n=1 Tax=Roseobacter denitrificans (strain ATCC 33942 / OCh 114) TaxID=375451 RepID=Q167C8_ROSDO|nr:hypothetical protein RD1_2339 [Roseobacter denitrificans OCh 114]
MPIVVAAQQELALRLVARSEGVSKVRTTGLQPLL